MAIYVKSLGFLIIQSRSFDGYLRQYPNSNFTIISAKNLVLFSRSIFPLTGTIHTFL
ncbi:hypothetical protein [Okeania sp. SIO3B5]|uniref:hypothetical protein n=1 Tax=Okeania sp. SIO3B5 TaxID=2607811 RepID=UPI003456EAC2